MIYGHGEWADVEAVHPCGNKDRPPIPLMQLQKFQPIPRSGDLTRSNGECALRAEVHWNQGWLGYLLISRNHPPQVIDAVIDALFDRDKKPQHCEPRDSYCADTSFYSLYIAQEKNPPPERAWGNIVLRHMFYLPVILDDRACLAAINVRHKTVVIVDCLSEPHGGNKAGKKILR